MTTFGNFLNLTDTSLVICHWTGYKTEFFGFEWNRVLEYKVKAVEARPNYPAVLCRKQWGPVLIFFWFNIFCLQAIAAQHDCCAQHSQRRFFLRKKYFTRFYSAYSDLYDVVGNEDLDRRPFHSSFTYKLEICLKGRTR